MRKIMAEVPGNSDFLEVSGVRCYERDGVAYLKLEDVARGLGFTQTKNGTEYVRWETVNGLLAEFHFPNLFGKVVDRLDNDEKGCNLSTTAGRIRETWIISKSGLYKRQYLA